MLLRSVDMEYLWMGDALRGLGGEWTANTAARGFKLSVKALYALTESARVAIMCTEADWRGAYRSFIAKALTRARLGRRIRHYNILTG